MRATLLARLVVVATGLTLGVTASCTAESQDAGREQRFCELFPTREAEHLARVADDPALRDADPAVAAELVRLSAPSLADGAPPAVAAPARVYADALRSFRPGDDILARPEVAGAAASITEWLRAHCGAPTGTR